MRLLTTAHELGLTVWTHNCRGDYEIRSASEGTYEDIASRNSWQSNTMTASSLNGIAIQLVISKTLEALKDSKAEVVFGLLSS